MNVRNFAKTVKLRGFIGEFEKKIFVVNFSRFSVLVLNLRMQKKLEQKFLCLCVKFCQTYLKEKDELSKDDI
jgi:hypothetical protein